MTSKYLHTVAAIALLASACGTATTGASTLTTVSSTAPTTGPVTTESTTQAPNAPSTVDGANPTTTAADVDSDGETGTLAINLEPIDGVFIEGFEVGIRIESIDGEVLYASLWTDFVESLGDTNLGRYYDSVLIQQLPAGQVVVMATVSIGAGPGPVRPDINGDLNCTLEVDIPSDGQANVEVAFDARDNCLRETTLT